MCFCLLSRKFFWRSIAVALKFFEISCFFCSHEKKVFEALWRKYFGDLGVGYLRFVWRMGGNRSLRACGDGLFEKICDSICGGGLWWLFLRNLLRSGWRVIFGSMRPLNCASGWNCIVKRTKKNTVSIVIFPQKNATFCVKNWFLINYLRFEKCLLRR